MAGSLYPREAADHVRGVASIASGLVALLPVPETMLAASVLVGCGVMLAFVLYGARVGSRAAAEVSASSDR